MDHKLVFNALFLELNHPTVNPYSWVWLADTIKQIVSADQTQFVCVRVFY